MANDDRTTVKRPGPSLWLSIIILSGGLVASCWGMWVSYNTILETITIGAFDIPGSQTRNLSTGDYEIYVRTGSSFDFNQTNVAALPALDEIVVTNVDTGENVPIQPLFLSESLGRGANRYDSVASFTVNTEAAYSVEINSISEAERAIFARDIETGLRDSVPWLILAGVGLLVFIIGSVLLVVGLVRRKRARDAGPATPPVPPAVGPPVASDVRPASSPPPPKPAPPRPSAAPSAAPTSAPVDRTSRTETETPWSD